MYRLINLVIPYQLFARDFIIICLVTTMTRCMQKGWAYRSNTYTHKNENKKSYLFTQIWIQFRLKYITVKGRNYNIIPEEHTIYKKGISITIKWWLFTRDSKCMWFGKSSRENKIFFKIQAMVLVQNVINR